MPYEIIHTSRGYICGTEHKFEGRVVLANSADSNEMPLSGSVVVDLLFSFCSH